MCGARRSILQANAPKSSKEAVHPLPTPAPLPGAGPVSPPSARPRPQGKKRSPLWTFLLIFVLLQFIPLVLNFSTDNRSVDRQIAEQEVRPGGAYEESIPVDFPHPGIWQSGDGLEIALSQTPDDFGALRYVVLRGNITETGIYSAYPCTSEDGWYFPDAFPEETYDWWMVQLSPEQWSVTQEDAPPEYTAPDGYGQIGGSLSVFQSRENPEETYFISDYDPIPWIPLGEVYPMTRFGGAADADALTAQYGSLDPV